MKAIEINTRTDRSGNLRIDIPLKQIETKVRVLILLQEEDDIEDEQKWLYAVAESPSLDFLNEPAEDIYSINDGIPYPNEK